MKRAVTWVIYDDKEGNSQLNIMVTVTGKLVTKTDSAMRKIDEMMRANGFKPS